MTMMEYDSQCDLLRGAKLRARAIAEAMRHALPMHYLDN